LLKETEAFLATTLQRGGIHQVRDRPQAEEEPELPHKKRAPPKAYRLCWVPPAGPNKREKIHIPRPVLWMLNQDRVEEALALWKTIDPNAQNVIDGYQRTSKTKDVPAEPWRVAHAMLGNRKSNSACTVPHLIDLTPSDAEWFAANPGVTMKGTKDAGVTEFLPADCPVADEVKAEYQRRLCSLTNFKFITDGHFHVVGPDHAVLGIEKCNLCDVKTLI
jgi:hypothetical protein